MNCAAAHKESSKIDKLRFIAPLVRQLLKVLLELFQKLVGAAAIGGRPPQRAKLLYPSKAPPKGEFSPKAKRGEPHKWGVPLIP